jgi:TPR repeat protein
LWRKAGREATQARKTTSHCVHDGEGVAKDLAEAVRLWGKGAEKNHSESMVNLAICYLNGDGVERDREEAMRFYRRVSQLGDGGGSKKL